MIQRFQHSSAGSGYGASKVCFSNLMYASCAQTGSSGTEEVIAVFGSFNHYLKLHSGHSRSAQALTLKP